MKSSLLFTSLACAASICISACNKSSNSFAVTDHTVGMTAVKVWSGTADGYSPKDTTFSGALHAGWPCHFGRTITDTSFAVTKVDGFLIKVLGTPIPYKLTDSLAQYVKFDTASATMSATLMFYYTTGSMTYVIHRVDSFSTEASQYYQLNESLHTP